MLRCSAAFNRQLPQKLRRYLCRSKRITSCGKEKSDTDQEKQ